MFLLEFTFDEMVWYQDFDYTQQGFFPDFVGFAPEKIALHNGSFYITNSQDKNVTYLYTEAVRRIEEVRGGPYVNSEWSLGDYHVFAGLRQGLTYFGGIYKENSMDAVSRYLFGSCGMNVRKKLICSWTHLD